MRLLSNLLFKVTLSSMIVTAPAMINGNTKYSNSLPEKETTKPFYSSAVIRKFIDHPMVMGIRAVAVMTTGSAIAANATLINSAVIKSPAAVAVAAPLPEPVPAAATEFSVAKAAKAAELRIVMYQAALIYARMDLEDQGLNQKAFEYAWRGYHNMLKKGLIRKKSVLSICDFSQSSRTRRMYVIDVEHKKLLYRTYVAHGQNSGDEFATTFSNDEDSYKSSLGFYVTQRTYIGRNGLSLRLSGVDPGYNDMAFKRRIVLHGSTYVSDKYMQAYGTLGTSLGCPAIPSSVSGKIIRIVKDGSCLFIYHPTQQYLDGSAIING
jgi:hypothetical protein